MDSLVWQLAALLVTIAVILVVIMKLRVNAAMTLVVGAILLGLLVGIPLDELATTISSGFGSMMGSIGLSIGFGIILGQLMADTGAAHTIADKIVGLFPANRAIYALALAAFILSIPVFFDVTFVILIPIGLAVLPRTGKSIAHLVGALSIGAGLSHMLVPPTPAPLAAGEIFGFDVGTLIAIGVPLGLVAVPTSVWIYSTILDRAILRWDPARDVATAPSITEDGDGGGVHKCADEHRTAASDHGQTIGTVSNTGARSLATAVTAPIDSPAVGTSRPGFGVAMLPILVPIVLILATTVTGMVAGDVPAWLSFIGDKTIAMLLGAFTAYVVGLKYLGQEAAVESVENSLGALGTVLLITGAGGSFAAIIGVSGISDSIATAVGATGSSPLLLVVLGFAVGVLLRVATGSGTVAALTSMPILSAAGAGADMPLQLLALPCLAGSLAGSTVNDSGFWIVTKLSGFSTAGGIKTYTVPVAISSLVVFVILLVWAAIVQFA